MNQDNSDVSEDEEEIRKRLYADMDQVSLNDTMTERSFVFENKQYEYHDLAQSQTWQEFLNQNKQRDEYLKKIDEDINLMKKINKGHEQIEIEDDNGEIIKIQIEEQLNQEEIKQLRPDFQIPEQIIQYSEEKYINQQNNIIQDEILQSSNNNNNNNIKQIKENNQIVNKQQEPQKKQEYMNQQRELFQMEIEDERSKIFNDEWRKNLFKRVQYTLPEEFPKIQKILQNQPNLQFQVPVFSYKKVVIPQIQKLTKENLAPNNTKELVFNKLSKLQLPKLQYETFEPINQKQQKQESQLIQIDCEVKYNIVYQEYLKMQNKLILQNNESSIYWKKVNNIFSDLKNMIKQLYNQPLNYKPYKQPYRDNNDENAIMINNIEKEISHNDFEQYLVDNQISIFHRKIEIKLENLTSLEGIQKMKHLRLAIFSSNKLQQITPLSYISTLIEIDLSQNQIINYSEVGCLQNLRVLKLEMNQIQEMGYLQNCRYLEILSLKGNKIQQIKNINNLIFLKQLFLFKNKLRSIQNLENNILIEILDLSSNMIETKLNESPFQNNQCLRKLILSKNKIQFLPELQLLLLNELYLNHNKLENLSSCILLPSLKILQVSENNIQACLDTEDLISYLPNLEQLDISINQIQSFGTIIKFIQRSQNIKSINYDENPFLFGLSDEVFQLFRFLLTDSHIYLSEVNNQAMHKIDQQFLRNKFYGFVETNQEENCEISKYFTELIIQLNKNTNSIQILNNLEYRKVTQNHPFSYTERFKLLQIMNDFNFLKNSFKIQVNVQNEINQYEQYYKKSIIKINSFIIKWIYKYRKLKKYYSNKVNQIILIQANIRGLQVRQQPEIKLFLSNKLHIKKQKYVIKIQRAWRKYIIRKRKQERMKNIEFQDEELDDLNNFDLNFINQDMDYNFELRIPQGVNLQELFKQQQINKSQLDQQFKIQAQQKVQEKLKQSSQQNLKAETVMKTSHFSSTGSQMAQSKYSEKTNKTEQLPNLNDKTKQIMQNWGFKDQAVAQTIAHKLQQEQKRKKKTKELNADEKLQRFRQMVNKH